MVITLYLDWADGYDPRYAGAVAMRLPLITSEEVPATRWRIDLDTITGEVTARHATVEERGAK
jgi:hypothetical protein